MHYCVSNTCWNFATNGQLCDAHELPDDVVRGRKTHATMDICGHVWLRGMEDRVVCALVILAEGVPFFAPRGDRAFRTNQFFVSDLRDLDGRSIGWATCPWTHREYKKGEIYRADCDFESDMECVPGLRFYPTRTRAVAASSMIRDYQPHRCAVLLCRSGGYKHPEDDEVAGEAPAREA
jgi:hypothetical protein